MPFTDLFKNLRSTEPSVIFKSMDEMERTEVFRVEMPMLVSAADHQFSIDGRWEDDRVVEQKHFDITWVLAVQHVEHANYWVDIVQPTLPKGFTMSYRFYDRMGSKIRYGRLTYEFDIPQFFVPPVGVAGYFIGVEVTLKWPKQSGWQFASEDKMCGADVTLIVDGEEFHTHRVLLSFVSPVFAKMFNGEYRETHQPIVNITAIDGVNALGFEAFLRCVYPINCEEPDEFFLVQLAILADYYDVKALFEKCRDRLKASTAVSKVEKMKVALRVNDPDLEECVMESLTPRDINDLVDGELQDQLGEDRLKKMIKKLLSSFE